MTDPCPDLKLGKPSKKLLICSNDQLLNIKNYVRHRDTDPERSLLLSLVLFFGFSTADLSQAQIVIQEDKLHIKLRRKQLTKGKRYYYRKELIQLPLKPKWFLNLQKRFIHNWSEHFKRVKKTYPNTPLVLPYSNISNRYMNTDTVRNRVKLATVEATGNYIPIRVLRQTCGHIYSSKADASILSTMGWSNSFAFHYTWLPRTYYRSETDSSETYQGNAGEQP